MTLSSCYSPKVMNLSCALVLCQKPLPEVNGYLVIQVDRHEASHITLWDAAGSRNWSALAVLVLRAARLGRILAIVYCD